MNNWRARPFQGAVRYLFPLLFLACSSAPENPGNAPTPEDDTGFVEEEDTSPPVVEDSAAAPDTLAPDTRVPDTKPPAPDTGTAADTTVATDTFVPDTSPADTTPDVIASDAGACTGLTSHKGSIYITSSTDADLATLGAIECLDGSLFIESTGLTTVSFPKLKVVTGALRVTGNSSLTAIAFDGLTNVGFDLRFSTNANVASIALPLLARVGGTLEINAQGKIPSLALPALKSVTASCWITRNPLMTMLSLPALETADYLLVSGVGSTTAQPSLAKLELPVFKSARVMTIADSQSMTTLTLPELTTITDSIYIQSMRSLSTISLPKLSTVTTGFWITNDYELTSFDAPAMTSVGRYLYISYNWKLTTLNGLRNLTSVGESVSVNGNRALTDLTGLGKLTSYKTLSVIENDELLSLNGLGKPPITATLGLASNPKLASIAALSGITQIGSLDVSRTALPNLTGLESLSTVSGGFTLSNMPALTSVSALSKLTYVGGQLYLYDAPKLTSIELPLVTKTRGLSVYKTAATTLRMPLLTHIERTTADGDFRLSENANLATVDLPRLAGVGWAFSVTTNPKLSTCAMYALRDRIKAADGIGYWMVTISGNLADTPCP